METKPCAAMLSSTRLVLQEVDFEASKISLPHCDAVQVHLRPGATKASGTRKQRLKSMDSPRRCENIWAIRMWVS